MAKTWPPKGRGWQPIPQGTRGGYRRKDSHGEWERRYPPNEAPQLGLFGALTAAKLKVKPRPRPSRNPSHKPAPKLRTEPRPKPKPRPKPTPAPPKQPGMFAAAVARTRKLAGKASATITQSDGTTFELAAGDMVWYLHPTKKVWLHGPFRAAGKAKARIDRPWVLFDNISLTKPSADVIAAAELAARGEAPAPRITRTGLPYKKPMPKNLPWSTVDEWLAGWPLLAERPPGAPRFAAEDRHFAALQGEKGLAAIAAATDYELTHLRAHLKNSRPTTAHGEARRAPYNEMIAAAAAEQERRRVAAEKVNAEVAERKAQRDAVWARRMAAVNAVKETYTKEQVKALDGKELLLQWHSAKQTETITDNARYDETDEEMIARGVEHRQAFLDAPILAKEVKRRWGKNTNASKLAEDIKAGTVDASEAVRNFIEWPWKHKIGGPRSSSAVADNVISRRLTALAKQGVFLVSIDKTISDNSYNRLANNTMDLLGGYFWGSPFDVYVDGKLHAPAPAAEVQERVDDALAQFERGLSDVTDEKLESLKEQNAASDRYYDTLDTVRPWDREVLAGRAALIAMELNTRAFRNSPSQRAKAARGEAPGTLSPHGDAVASLVAQHQRGETDARGAAPELSTRNFPDPTKGHTSEVATQLSDKAGNSLASWTGAMLAELPAEYRQWLERIEGGGAADPHPTSAVHTGELLHGLFGDKFSTMVRASTDIAELDRAWYLVNAHASVIDAAFATSGAVHTLLDLISNQVAFAEGRPFVTDIPCPQCNAPAGSSCKRPSGHETTRPHAVRMEAAAAAPPDRAIIARTERVAEAAKAEIRAAAATDPKLSELLDAHSEAALPAPAALPDPEFDPAGDAERLVDEFQAQAEEVARLKALAEVTAQHETQEGERRAVERRKRRMKEGGYSLTSNVNGTKTWTHNVSGEKKIELRSSQLPGKWAVAHENELYVDLTSTEAQDKAGDIAKREMPPAIGGRSPPGWERMPDTVKKYWQKIVESPESPVRWKAFRTVAQSQTTHDGDREAIVAFASAGLRRAEAALHEAALADLAAAEAEAAALQRRVVVTPPPGVVRPAADPDDLDGLIVRQERDKAINKIVRSSQGRGEKVASIEALGVPTAEAQSYLVPDFAGRDGIPSHTLSNRRAKIKRLQAVQEHVEIEPLPEPVIEPEPEPAPETLDPRAAVIASLPELLAAGLKTARAHDTNPTFHLTLPLGLNAVDYYNEIRAAAAKLPGVIVADPPRPYTWGKHVAYVSLHRAPTPGNLERASAQAESIAQTSWMPSTEAEARKKLKGKYHADDIDHAITKLRLHPRFTEDAAGKFGWVSDADWRSLEIPRLEQRVRQGTELTAEDSEALKEFTKYTPVNEYENIAALATIQAILEPPAPVIEPEPEAAPEIGEVRAAEAAPVLRDPGLMTSPAAPAAPGRAAVMGTYRTDGQRKKANRRALELAIEQRPLTPAEQMEVAAYSGEGGIEASLNQFWTHPDVAKAAWDLMAKHGFKGGNVLEPAVGAGVFIETAPAGASMTGVELDQDVAEISQALHGHESAIYNQSFEQFSVAGEGVREKFDAVVTNAPFVTRGDGTVYDHKPHIRSADKYFLDTALDHVKPGGLVAMIVHSNVMTGGDGDFRQRMMERGELVDAIRLPGQVWKNAGTGVTADLILLRKRPGKAEVTDERVRDGHFFTDNPEKVLGEIVEGYRTTVEGDAELVPDAIRASVPYDGPAAQPAELHSEELAEPSYKIGDTRINHNVPYILLGDPPRWRKVSSIEDVGAYISDTADVEITDARAVAQMVAELSEAYTAGDAHRVAGLRRKTIPRLKAWIERNGPPADHEEISRLAKTDAAMVQLQAAIQPDGTLSPAMVLPVMPRIARELDVTNVHDVAAYLAAQSGGTIDAGHLHNTLQGMSRLQAAEAMNADGRYVPVKGGWVHREEFLTGDLWKKKAETLNPELTALIDEAIKADWSNLDDVNLSMLGGWIPPDLIETWMHTQGMPSHMELIRVDGVYALEDRHSAVQKILYTGAETLPQLKKKGYSDPPDFHKVMKFLNNIRTKSTINELRALDREWQEWARTSAARARIEQTYNRTFNGVVARNYGSAPLGLEGINPNINLHAYQNQTVRWAAEKGRGIIALDVGLGKTFCGIMLARLLAERGQSKRAVAVVPKSVLTNWAEEVETLTPGAKVMIIGESRTYSKINAGKATRKADKAGLTGKDRKDYIKANSYVISADKADVRNAKLAQVQQGDYDLVIMSKEAFAAIPLRPETSEDLLGDRASNRSSEAMANVKAGEWGSKTNEKKRAKIRADLEQKDAVARGKTEGLIYFEDIGFDTMIADEAHAYKNLDVTTSGWGTDDPKYMGVNKQGAAISRSMEDRSQIIRKHNGDGSGVYFLTATPTKNSPLEIYNMIQHIDPEAWIKRGIYGAASFVERYCMVEDRDILTDKGGFETKQCVVGFDSLDELKGVIEDTMLVRTADNVGLPIPEAQHEQISVDMTDLQEAMYQGALDESAALADNDALTKEQKASERLKLFGKIINLGYDTEMADASLVGSHKDSPKYKAAVGRIIEGLANGHQLVFADRIKSHNWLKAMLVEAGVPAEQIGIMNAQVAPKGADRQKLGKEFNTGVTKILIGNTQTMGEGVNLQKKTTDLHHLDVDWSPGAMHQREGRAVRQGNPNDSVKVHTYLTRKTIDGYKASMVVGKKTWLSAAYGGATTSDMVAGEDSLQDIEQFIRDAEGLATFQNNKAARIAVRAAKAIRTANTDAAKWSKMAVRAAAQREGSPERKRSEAIAKSLRRKITSNPSTPPFLLEAVEAGAEIILAQSGDAVWEGCYVGDHVVTSINIEKQTVFIRKVATAGGSVLPWKELKLLRTDVTPDEMLARVMSQDGAKSGSSIIQFSAEAIAENREAVQEFANSRTRGLGINDVGVVAPWSTMRGKPGWRAMVPSGDDLPKMIAAVAAERKGAAWHIEVHKIKTYKEMNAIWGSMPGLWEAARK